MRCTMSLVNWSPAGYAILLGGRVLPESVFKSRCEEMARHFQHETISLSLSVYVCLSVSCLSVSGYSACRMCYHNGCPSSRRFHRVIFMMCSRPGNTLSTACIAETISEITGLVVHHHYRIIYSAPITVRPRT